MQAMIIADDLDEREILIYALRKAGLAVASSSFYKQVLSNWTDHPADLIVIALQENPHPAQMLEDVRAITQIPILMIVEPQGEKMLCSLLEMGADVVLYRPVSVKVLQANVKALSRRTSAIPSFVLPTLSLPRISLDTSSRAVTVLGEEAKRLTQLEFRLLYTLMTNRGQVVPTDVITERVWGYTGEGNRELVRGLISRLRRKLDSALSTHSFIETIPGVGYCFTADDD
jgi:DNA-binding response OmpR family regulator